MWTVIWREYMASVPGSWLTEVVMLCVPTLS